MSIFHNNVLLGTSGSGGDPLYVDDVFSTFLYEGNGSTQTITNGINLSGEGGLVWLKNRDAAERHSLQDTERGVNKLLDSSDNIAEASITSVNSFNSDGFGLNSSNSIFNGSGEDYVSWTFRKAPGFFDVVTWTGNGSVRTISHNLGSTPGFIIIKRTSAAEDWTCYHRSIGATDFIQMNGDNNGASNKVDLEQFMNDTEPTSTNFTVGTHDRVNTNGETYVAYVFAHNDQSFGTDSDEAIIKCDKYTGNATSGKEVSLGFEPQWLMIKKYDGSNQGRWFMVDIMRGIADGTNQTAYLAANRDDAEANTTAFVAITDGFRILSTGAESNQSGTNYAYIAIRRPHKPPTAGTDVFKAVTYSGSSSAQTITGAGFAPDWMWSKDYSASNNGWYHDRVRGVESLDSSGNGGEQDRSSYVKILGQDGIEFIQGGFDLNRNGSSHVAQFMKRAPGFFDIVTYTGTGSNSSNNGQQNITHNLGAVPELIIVKKTDAADDFVVYNATSGAGENMRLNRTNASASDIYCWDNTTPTSSVFRVGADISSPTNSNTKKFVAWLFATLDGISKVGSYSGTGSDVDVDCGFSAGARYVLIKREDSTGDWYVWDHARGIVSGNDPYLIANTTAAQTTGNDYIDPLNSGFTVTSSAPDALNVNGGTYIFLAIA